LITSAGLASNSRFHTKQIAALQMGFYRNRSELLNEEEYKAQKMRFFHIKIKETAKSEML